jgi:type II secretory ATPase GspE/PulE/Tfp pilus assembly ATPase PilB-like protein
MDGINQSQVDPYHDYTFSKGLRSILRQDPDICMVGEIRDLETAEIAIQMALTGHLMLSTIHTNSASGVIPRFLSMGVKPFLLAPSLNSVIGHRS